MEREQAERIVDGILYDLSGRSGVGDALEGLSGDDSVILEMRETLIAIVITPPPPVSAAGGGKRPWWIQQALGNQRRALR